MVEIMQEEQQAVAVGSVVAPTMAGVAAMVKGKPATLRIGDIHRAEGAFVNPRTTFDEVELAELRESIRAQGLNQPILVRPRAQGGWEIVAGERRWRVMLDLHGQDGEIEVLIKELDDDQAQAAALTENVERAPMNPVEEARAAHRIFLRVNGDVECAAERLGMKPETFKRRMALMRASEGVQKALVEQKIALGHAELLAAVDLSKQDSALEQVIKRKLSVGNLKDQVLAMSCDLPAAIFDKADCTNCEFNSAVQTALFTEAVTEGRCTRPTCYEAKQEGKLQEIAGSLGDEYAKVTIMRGGDHIIPIKLVALGKHGVGEEQASACRSCASFGCSVSGVVGSMGKVEHGVCFDSPCNARHVLTNRKALEAAEQAERDASNLEPKETTSGAKKKPASTGVKAGAGKAEKKGGPAKKTAAPAPVAVQLSSGVKSYRVDIWRKIAAKQTWANPDMALRVLVALALNGSSRHISSNRTRDALEKISGQPVGHGIHNMKEATDAVRETDPLKLQRVTHAMAASAMADLDETGMRQVMEFLGVDMGSGSVWKLDEGLLALLSKAEIEVIAEEVGISTILGSAAMKKAMATKKGELIATILGLKEFDYTRAVPRCMEYRTTNKEAIASGAALPGAAEADDGHQDDEEEEVAAQG